MNLQTMALITGALLVLYITGMLYALIVPPRHRDPHDGMARGCLMFVILGLLAIGGLVALGVATDTGWLVRIPFYLTVYPAVMIIVGGLVKLYKDRKQRD